MNMDEFDFIMNMNPFMPRNPLEGESTRSQNDATVPVNFPRGIVALPSYWLTCYVEDSHHPGSAHDVIRRWNIWKLPLGLIMIGMIQLWQSLPAPAKGRPYRLQLTDLQGRVLKTWKLDEEGLAQICEEIVNRIGMLLRHHVALWYRHAPLSVDEEFVSIN